MSLQKLFTFIIKKKELFILFFILLLAILLRFVNYTDRWGLAADQARDVLIVREALHQHTLPLIGPFSASGPFVFGPLWYWVFMIPIALFPNSILAPWIFQGSLYVLSVALMYVIGKKLINQNFGLLMALFTAISPARIILSTNLIMSSLVGIVSVIILYFFVTYLKSKKTFALVFVAFFIGFAINVHPEAIPLTFLLAFCFYFEKKSLKNIVLTIVFFLIPFIPLLIFNTLSHNFELANLFHPHRTLAGKFIIFNYTRQFILFFANSLPNIWAYGIGGNKFVAIACLVLLTVTIGFAIFRKKMQKETGIIFFATVCMVLVVGVYNGALFRAFFSFLFPFSIILTAWLCWYLWTVNKGISLCITLIIIFYSFLVGIQGIDTATNNAAETAQFWENTLSKKASKKTFQVYDYKGLNKDKSLSLSMFLDVHNKIAKDGMKIGVSYYGAPVGHQILVEGPDKLRIYDLDNISNEKLTKEGFTSVTATYIYSSVENWWKK